VVCNIAGINDRSFPLLDTDDALWDRIMELDLKAPFRICRAAVPVMVAGGGGAIINIGSYAALRGNHGPSYTAAKAGLVGLTKSIAFCFMDQGIRCNIIHPGGMRTKIGEHSGGEYHQAQAKLSKICAAMPALCYGDPVEIANACLFLASDEAKLINGAELSVDLGMSVC
jgi:NAD(P)-dependent dehydrogenase (short-subunit alcohol dehydrogenase family)